MKEINIDYNGVTYNLKILDNKIFKIYVDEDINLRDLLKHNIIKELNNRRIMDWGKNE